MIGDEDKDIASYYGVWPTLFGLALAAAITFLCLQWLMMLRIITSPFRMELPFEFLTLLAGT